MKKTIFKLLLLLSIASLSSCTLINLAKEGSNESQSSGESDSQSEGESSEEGESESESESDTEESESESQSQSESTSKTVIKKEVIDNADHFIGEVYFNNPQPEKVILTYDDNSTEEFYDFTVTKVLNVTAPDGSTFTKTRPFSIAGTYTTTLNVTVNGTSYKSIPFAINVLSGLDCPTFVLNSIELTDEPVFNAGDVLSDNLVLNLTLNWGAGVEYYRYDYLTDTSNISVALRKGGDPVTDYINEALVQNVSYQLEVSYKTYKAFYDFTVSGNYYRLASSDLTILNRDLNTNYAVATGDVKVLIIPITLSGSYTDEWTNTKLNNLYDFYFGMEENKISLKKYYETASFGQMEVSGIVTDPYTETSSSLTTDEILDDDSMGKLHELIARAVDYVKVNNPSINFDEYDLNDDGTIDNVHLLTNFDSNAYGDDAWGQTLWPHMSQTGNVGTLMSPVANTYSLSAIDHMLDGITQIHEQGHIFGLQDYYDYDSSGADYVGGADMQSYNIFDWNSYSKLSVGWVSPYVVTGETELTFKAASLNGDCVIIPANPDTFNNSAFDEYFLIELFSPYGNNNFNYPQDGTYYGGCWGVWSNSFGSLGSYGVRLYHVDSRIAEWNGSQFVEVNTLTTGRYSMLMCDNDSYGYSGRWSYNEPWKDYKLLSIMQAGKVDTFSGSRPKLQSSDLFHKNDVFTFNDYKHFLSKSGASVSTMDNGESFPYKITFTDMSKDQATIKIELI